MNEPSRVVNFFKDQTVFITGGTGFVGKVIIEKILRECWQVKKIYVLMRAKKNQTSQERFDQLFTLPCFDRIRHKNFKEKLFFIDGDCNKPFLGINDQDLTMLKEQTTILIHAAANVRFDQSFTEISQCIKATQDMITLVKAMPILKVFLYVSTAYSNCIHSHIKEDFYEPPMKAETFINLVDSLDSQLIEKLTPVLLDQWPNTYVFGKSMNEDLIKRANLIVPTAIVRPSIIINAINEPVPGWIDNIYGIVGVFAGSSIGIIHTVHVCKNYPMALVPVDHVANNIIATTWYTAEKNSTKVDIYNCVGFEYDVPFTVHKVVNALLDIIYEQPPNVAIWKCFIIITSHRWWYKVCKLLLHTLPSYLIDSVLFVFGKKTIAVKGYRKLNNVLDHVSYFSIRKWVFDQNNMKQLWDNMNERDKRTFNFSLKKLNFRNYMWNVAFGIRTFLMKLTPESIPQGRRKLRILAALHYTFVSLIFYLLYKLFAFLFRMLYEENLQAIAITNI